MDFNSGGKKVIERLVEAYGFTTRQALCDHLGVSKSTMATRYMRDIFPADWVLQCALETNTPLEWLAFGKGELTTKNAQTLNALSCFDLINGSLVNMRICSIEQELLPKNLNHPYIVNYGNDSYILSKEDVLTNGHWLVSIDNEISFRSIYKLPNNKMRVEDEHYSFECNNNELQLDGKVKSIIKRGM